MRFNKCCAQGCYRPFATSWRIQSFETEKQILDSLPEPQFLDILNSIDGLEQVIKENEYGASSSMNGRQYDVVVPRAISAASPFLSDGAPVACRLRHLPILDTTMDATHSQPDVLCRRRVEGT